MRAGGAAGVLELVAASGGSPARVLASAGVSSDDLADPDRLIETRSIALLYDAAARETGDDAFGLHLGERYPFAGLGTISYAVLNAPSVETGLRNLDRYGQLQIQGGRLALEQKGADASLTYDIGVDPESARQHAEAAAVVGVRLLQHLIGDDWRPRQVLFGHRRPTVTAEHARVLRAPLRFAQPLTAAIVFDAADLARAVPHADRGLLPIVERHLDELLASTAGADDWLAKVRSAVAESLADGAPAIETIARRLALSVRTLQRRLGEQGVVFKTLVDELRRDLALQYLADGKADLTEIAFLVGYSELSAFDRAFRRWTGSTPVAARKELRAGGRPLGDPS
jgi:AraC-like DNA-binding protein